MSEENLMNNPVAALSQDDQGPSDKVVESKKSTIKPMEDMVITKEVRDLGVPKFLVNKWLNIGQKKSKFTEEHCQVDNKDDVSVYSKTTISHVSSVMKQSKGIKNTSQFSNTNVCSSLQKIQRHRFMSSCREYEKSADDISVSENSESEVCLKRYPSLLNAKLSCSSFNRSSSLKKEPESARGSEKSVGLDYINGCYDRKCSLKGPHKLSCFKDLEPELGALRDLIIEADESDTLTEVTPHSKLIGNRDDILMKDKPFEVESNKCESETAKSPRVEQIEQAKSSLKRELDVPTKTGLKMNSPLITYKGLTDIKGVSGIKKRVQVMSPKPTLTFKQALIDTHIFKPTRDRPFAFPISLFLLAETPKMADKIAIQKKIKISDLAKRFRKMEQTPKKPLGANQSLLSVNGLSFAQKLPNINKSHCDQLTEKTSRSNISMRGRRVLNLSESVSRNCSKLKEKRTEILSEIFNPTPTNLDSTTRHLPSHLIPVFGIKLTGKITSRAQAEPEAPTSIRGDGLPIRRNRQKYRGNFNSE